MYNNKYIKRFMIKRTHYLDEIRPFYESDLVKIITGIKGSGKTVLLKQIIEELKEQTDNIFYLNFEDDRADPTITDAEKLIEYVENSKKEGKAYVFFDEVQNLEGWQDACKTLRLHDCSVFITGSNSKLLSGEFTKELSGRYVSFRVRPFVYKEILEYSKELNKDVSITDYLIWGGFPKRFETENEGSQYTCLCDLNDTVINSIISNYGIRKTQLFNNLADYVVCSNGKIMTAKSIHSHIEQEYGSCSINTIMKFLEYLENYYVIEIVRQYSVKNEKELNFYVKLYDADVSLSSLRADKNRYDLLQNIENIVYNELIYMGYRVSAYVNHNRRVDFLAQKGNKQYYIQVAYSVQDEKTYDREFKAFQGTDPFSRKILITNDEIDYSTSAVEHIRLKDFLLMKDLERQH